MLNTDQALNTPAVVLSVDAIQEFKVLSETYSAQYGFAANQISIVSKSGTNSLHGSAFYFGRNDALDARNYFNRAPAPVAALRQHQFGFVVSGPVIIPKLYDGKNKTFFMADYEGWRIRQGTSSFYNVPSPTLLQGLFPMSVKDPTKPKDPPRQSRTARRRRRRWAWRSGPAAGRLWGHGRDSDEPAWART